MSFLCDSAQKRYSKLIEAINNHKMTIEKCEKYAKECPSDKVKRCKEGILYHQKQVEAHEAIVAERVRKVIEEGARDKEKKLQYLRDAEEKLQNELATKSRSQVAAETEIEKLQKELKQLMESNEAPKTAPKISSEWEQTLKEEQQLQAMRAARPSYTVDYNIPKSDTVYGAVSTLLPRAKKSIKIVKVINASTNLYSDEVAE